MFSARWVRAGLIGVTIAAVFNCAKGEQLGAGGAGMGGGTMMGPATGPVGSGGGPGGIGSPCPNGMCTDGTCTLIGGNKYCTTACPPTCPMGTYCSIINGNPICVPDLGQECDKCMAASDCKLPSDACLQAPPGDTFCARDCTIDGMCPNGFVCTDMTSYENPDAGTPDSGSGSGGTGGSDGGAVPSAPAKWCVPDGNASCPCNAQRDGVTHTCAITNMYGSCTSMETCDGKSAQWMGCMAMIPAMEICNGKDDNCNGQVDEGSPDSLCSFMGNPPAHAHWACVSGMCQLGSCDPGWTAFPPGPASAGCPCQVDANEPNGSCAMAAAVGSVQSVGGTPLVINGTLSSATNVDFYTFNTVDTPETGTNSYHVSISFTMPSPNSEFVMDVMRGMPCSDTPTGGATNITSYDWCVNGTSAVPVGEAPCGPSTNNVPHCADHSSVYYLRVYRNATATPTCTAYQITITGGGGACDTTQKCP
jgi:hypothetical protein